MPPTPDSSRSRERPAGRLSNLLAACLGLGALLLLLLPTTPVSQARPAATCPPVQNTLKYTIVYGAVTVGGLAAPAGAVVEARNPRGETVGCFEVTEAGEYGAMFVYGEDTSVSPPIPGMRKDEVVAFLVDSAAAVSDPVLTWADDKSGHPVNLAASAPATPTDTPAPTATAHPCAGDVDGSGRVDVADLQLLAAAFRRPTYDLVGGDGVVTLLDIMVAAAQYDQSCP